MSLYLTVYVQWISASAADSHIDLPEYRNILDLMSGTVGNDYVEPDLNTKPTTCVTGPQ